MIARQALNQRSEVAPARLFFASFFAMAVTNYPLTDSNADDLAAPHPGGQRAVEWAEKSKSPESLRWARGVVDRRDGAKYPGAFPPNSLASDRHDTLPAPHALGLPGPRPDPRGTGRQPPAHANDTRD